ncbi:DNA-binding transcriptional regulator, LysR family [Devosia enhydra]|uniref:DNA-binding transcriptional regulator, LysR family n=1 Tax=Devosia enhydra TaxID=665118 RepID=A0A1K2HX61_9HYPH|nr:LysR family transcriptional regulator [Devosia enhydra]SFZ83430.1 DNA-binding transcriptional regulator, LysR family [Devosia enhydra]
MSRHLRPLNPRQLEAFRAVMLTGSMTGAGRLLSISQPAVTRLIRDLEADLRLTLFLRDGAQISPTAEARELYREVARHFVSTERIREAAMAIRQYNAGRIRVASILALSSSCMPNAVDAFARTYPEMVVSVHSGASVDIIDLVVNGSVDVGFVAMPPGRNDLAAEPLPASEVVCLMPRNHPLARREVITPADLDGQDFVALGSSSLMRLELNALLQLSNAQPRIRVESLFSSTVAAYVDRGLGMAVVDPLAASVADPARTVARSFRPAIRYELSVVYPPHTNRPPPLQDFVNFFSEAYARELEATRALVARA